MGRPKKQKVSGWDGWKSFIRERLTAYRLGEITGEEVVTSIEVLMDTYKREVDEKKTGSEQINPFSKVLWNEYAKEILRMQEEYKKQRDEITRTMSAHTHTTAATKTMSITNGTTSRSLGSGTSWIKAKRVDPVTGKPVEAADDEVEKDYPF